MSGGGAASKDLYGNCCESGIISNGICVPSDGYNAILIQSVYCDPEKDLTYAPSYYCGDYAPKTVHDNPMYAATNNKTLNLYCVTPDDSLTVDSNGTLSCNNGFLVVIDQYGNYMPGAEIEEKTVGTDDNTTYINFTQTATKPTMSYKKKVLLSSLTTEIRTCTYTYDVVYEPITDNSNYTHQSYNSAASQWKWINENNVECITPNDHMSPVPASGDFMISY